MSDYVRMTAATIRDVLSTAETVLTERLPLEKIEESRHSITLSGRDGKVTITAHRHGQETEVVASTDQLRTSRIDLETQHFLNKLPYQPGDVPR